MVYSVRMSQRHVAASKQITIVIGLTVVSFMALGLTLSFYRNILFEQTLHNISQQNDALRQTIAQGRLDLEYYRSAQYKDKYAKENLGKVNPGEKVLIIADTNRSLVPVEKDDMILNEQQEAAYLELLRQMPVVEHWRMFLFYRDQVEELKQSFYQS